MKQLSIWNDITTIKQRYFNVLHEMTRIDEHPRRSYQGRNTYKSFTYLKDWTYEIFLQDYGIKRVILSKGQYKILKMVSSNFLIMLLEQR